MKNITKENRDIIYEGFQRLLFVEIRLERGKDNAQKIFESLNSTGLDLSQADLIRNYILMGLEPVEQTRFFNSYWAVIESNTKLDGKSDVSKFIRDYLTMKFAEIPNEKEVYDTFKRKFRIEDNINLDEVMGEIRNYSYIYRMLINPQTIDDSDIKREISYIKYIEVNVSYPFLLQVTDDYIRKIIGKDVLLNILKFIQTYVCRRFIVRLPTNAMNKIFMTLYKQIDKDDYENSLYYYIMTRSGDFRIPTDNEILNNLRTKNLYKARKMKLYILERMENFGNNEHVSIIGNSNITIEHIFPQKPENEWKKELSDDEYKQFMEKYLHTIGNLTLSGNNGALGNKSFSDKKYMNKDGKEQGYAFSRLWLNRSLREFEKWNISNYERRSKLLEERFLSIWSLPKIELDVDDTLEYNVCEMDLNIVTGKEIEYAIFFGKKLSGDKYNGIEIYNYILNELFTVCAKDEFISKFGDLLKLSENKQEFIRCKQLNSTYYYNTNLNYKQVFSNLRRILITLDMTDELYVKLKSKV